MGQRIEEKKTIVKYKEREGHKMSKTEKRN